MDFVLDELAIGDVRDGSHPPRAIEALLCVAQEIELPDWQGPALKVPIVDMKPIPPAQLREAADWIALHIGDKRLLVFCNAGVGRSSSVVVAYLCLYRQYGFGEAVEFIARKRPRMSILPELILSIEDAAQVPGPH